MTFLTPKFNSQAKINRREDAETEAFGGKSFSRHFSVLAFAAKHHRRVEIEIVQVHVPVPEVYNGPARQVRAPILRM